MFVFILDVITLYFFLDYFQQNNATADQNDLHFQENSLTHYKVSFLNILWLISTLTLFAIMDLCFIKL